MPKPKTARTAGILIKLRRDERQAVAQAAALLRQPPATFAREATVALARQLLEPSHATVPDKESADDDGIEHPRARVHNPRPAPEPAGEGRHRPPRPPATA